MGRAWDEAVNREFVAKLVRLAEAYPTEQDLLDDLAGFGGDVYELLYQTEELNFGKNPNEGIE